MDDGLMVRTGGHGAMHPIDYACREALGQVDGAIACAVVALHEGALIGRHCASQHAQELEQGAAVALADIFGTIPAIEALVRVQGPTGLRDEEQEVHIASEQSLQFARTLKRGRAVLVVVTKKTTPIGMGWAQVKSAAAAIEPLVP